MTKASVESVYDSLERVEVNVDALQTARTQAEAIARTRFPLAKDNDSVVSMPLHILIDAIQEGICSALSSNASQKEEA